MRMKPDSRRKQIVLLSVVLIILVAHTAQCLMVVFADKDWYVRPTSERPEKPSEAHPNYWSDSPENVTIDDLGLHLKITQSKGKWYCGEVFSKDFFGYGIYTFKIVPSGQLNENVVFGLFIDSANQEDPDEIDIEFTKWGNKDKTDNAQYNIQPEKGGREHPFFTDLNRPSTHRFIWLPDKVEYQSWYGHEDEPLSKDRVIHSWTFPSSGSDPDPGWIPVPDQERVYMNVWLCGDPGPSFKGAHVIVKDFSFKKLPQDNHLTFEIQTLSCPHPAGAADIADLNNDQKPDIVCGYYKNPNIKQHNYVYWGQGNRFFSKEEAFGKGTGIFGIKIAELTGDSLLDVLSLHCVENVPSLLFVNTGSGFSERKANLAKSSFWGGNGCEGLATGDLDGDGDLDAVSGHRGGYLYISFNDGHGNFTLTRLKDRGAHDDVEIADMDTDGDLDIVDSGPVNGWRGHSAIYWNAGDGTFPERTLLHYHPEHWGLSLGDLEGDGDVDIALGIGNADPAVVYENKGNRNFVLYGEYLSHRDVHLADLDRNGTMELIGAGVSGKGSACRTIHIYWDADPKSEPDKYVLGTSGDLLIADFCVADLDNDGNLDIFAGGEGTGSNYILWGEKESSSRE